MLTLDQVKNKSSVRLIGLYPVVLAASTVLIERCYARGVPILITQGLRTIAEQNGLFAQGRTQAALNAVGLSSVKAQPDKPKVTNAKGGTSYHNFGLAIDFALLLPDGKQVSWDLKRDGDGDKVADWTEVVQEAKAIGFEWGGDFVSIKDAPHFQMTFGLTTSQLRAGAKPSEINIAKATAIIDRLKEEAKENTGKIAELEAIVVKQDERLEAVEKRLNIFGKETYASNYTEAITAAKAAGAITTSADKSKLELNIIQMFFNLGLFSEREDK
jgi:peptidoglycan LD-endopeptidase CwlK